MRFMYLYNHNWDHEIAAYKRGEVPSHRLFGLADLQVLGYSVLTCPWPKRLARVPYPPLAWRIYQSCYALVRSGTFDYLVATHEAAALPLLLLRRIGIFRKPIVVINVALLHPKNLARRKRRLWAWVLPAAERIICYASVQTEWLQKEFNLDAARVSFIPLGVDTDYFQPSSVEANGDFCLSVGTNDGKDFATLVQALPPGIRLVAVTDGPNERIIKENALPEAKIDVRQSVPIAELKQLYQTARVHIIPIREMQFSSGQTVLLENMALGKTVIISDTSAIRDYVEDGVTALCVAPGNVSQLKEAIDRLWNIPALNREIGQRAAFSVRQRFSSQMFALKLIDLVSAHQKSDEAFKRVKAE